MSKEKTDIKDFIQKTDCNVFESLNEEIPYL
jgi:hypothetical protein